MALPNAGLIMEVRTGGADTNGGGFVTPSTNGTDYSLFDDEILAITDGATANGTTITLTSAAAGFTLAMEDNLLYLASGMNILAGWYQIVTYNSATSVDLDRTCSDGTAVTGGTGKVGGALATPGWLSKFYNDLPSSSQVVNSWIKSGTYTLTSSSASVSGGIVLLPSLRRSIISGYQTTRGDRAAKPVIAVNAQTSLIVWDAPNSTSGTPNTMVNIKIDGNSQSGIVGFDGGNTGSIYRCETLDCVTGFKALKTVYCLAVNGTTGFSAAHITVGCVAHGCSGTGIIVNLFAVGCLAYGCGEGFDVGSREKIDSCTAVNNTNAGFDIANAVIITNCLAAFNGAIGFDCTGQNSFGADNFSWSNTTPDNSPDQIEVAALTADPFTSQSTDDYTLNDTAGGGAVMRNAVALDTQTAVGDSGAVGHEDPAGGGGGGGTAMIGPGGGMIGAA